MLSLSPNLIETHSSEVEWYTASSKHVKTTLNKKTLPLYTYKTDHGVKWLKIFHQKYPQFFSKSEDALFSTEDGLFSIINLIDKRYKIHGYYEFLLEYPGKKGYNRWIQSEYPLDVHLAEGSTYVKGFEAINISWEQSISSDIGNHRFLGLGLSDFPQFTLLDGIADFWYFPIGQSQTKHCGKGYLVGYEYCQPTEAVILWLRVPDNIEEKSFARQCLTSIASLAFLSL